jgi:hypothetical protein
MKLRITDDLLAEPVIIEDEHFDEDNPRLTADQVIEVLDAWEAVDREKDGGRATWQEVGSTFVLALFDAGELTIDTWVRAPQGFWLIADWPFDFEVEVIPDDPPFDFESPEYLAGLDLVERLNSTIAVLGMIEWPRLRDGGDDLLYCPHCEMPVDAYSLTVMDVKRQYRSGIGFESNRVILATMATTTESRKFIKHSCGKPVQLPEGWVMM